TYLDASVVILLCLVALSGMTQTTQLASIQSLATAVVPVDKLSTAVSFMAFAQRSVSIIGAMLSGYLLFKAGSASVFLVATIPLAAACGFFATVPSTPVSHVQAASFWAALQTGAGELARVPAVVQLLGLMALAEIFGFAFNAFLPVLVSESFDRGPASLGVLAGAASIGAMAGLGLLALFASQLTNGRTLLLVVIAFGAMIMALAQSKAFAAGVVIVVGVGAAAALIDSLEWALLQASVRDALRGRVLGAWNVAIGMGWMGPIVVGAIAEYVGITRALTGAGFIVCIVGAGAFASGTLRRLTC
ncbi:MAG: MFS transporter, partial [Gammaproteobacteria bacterium]|nr:MFS transporter [Gammaproteobacteria bacterium]